MTAIEAKNISKTFKIVKREPGFAGALKAFWKREHVDVEAAKNISLNIQEGELVGFVGPNGAGKTTTLKMISGLLYPTGGLVTTLGFSPQKREHAFLRAITLVMGNRSQLWWEIPVEESLKLNKEIYELSDDFYSNSLTELVDLLEIKDILQTPVKKLSLGQRMKAELCAALLHRPKLLLLDEPTLGLDILMQKKVRKFLAEYNKKSKATILLTSHNMDDVLELCERILIIDRGSLIYDGSLKDVIAKYAPTKRIRVDFAQTMVSELAQEWKLRSVNGDHLAFEANVLRKEIPSFTAQLLNAAGSKIPDVADLTIEETPIEEIIGKIFEGKGS